EPRPERVARDERDPVQPGEEGGAAVRLDDRDPAVVGRGEEESEEEDVGGSPPPLDERRRPPVGQGAERRDAGGAVEEELPGAPVGDDPDDVHGEEGERRHAEEARPLAPSPAEEGLNAPRPLRLVEDADPAAGDEAPEEEGDEGEGAHGPSQPLEEGSV